MRFSCTCTSPWTRDGARRRGDRLRHRADLRHHADRAGQPGAATSPCCASCRRARPASILLTIGLWRCSALSSSSSWLGVILGNPHRWRYLRRSAGRGLFLAVPQPLLHGRRAGDQQTAGAGALTWGIWLLIVAGLRDLGGADASAVLGFGILAVMSGLFVVLRSGLIVVFLPRGWKINFRMALRNIGRQRRAR